VKRRKAILAGVLLAAVCVSMLAGIASGDARTVRDVSALRQVPDEGGARIEEAMRNSPTVMQGVAALKAGALPAAVAALGESIAEDGNTGAVARYLYAEALVRMGRPANALYYYNEFMSRWPGHPLADDLLVGIALVYLESGRDGDAESWLRRVITDCPQGDRLPLARLLLVGNGSGRGASSDRESSDPSMNSSRSADKLDTGELSLRDRAKALDERESRIEARERLLADAEKKLEIDRKRVLDIENTLLGRKQQLDTREKALDARATALDKREKELKDFENR